MKCIDAIEGIVKHILHQLHGLCVDQHLDDSEYVRNVKAVISATNQYLVENPELIDSPQLLTDVLYAYSRGLWLSSHQTRPPVAEVQSPENQEYQTYYYDFLYHRGLYPR